MDLKDIGRICMSFALVYAILSSILYVSLAAAGEPFNAPVLVPAQTFYSIVQSIYSAYPNGVVSTVAFVATAAIALALAAMNFIYLMMTAFINMAIVIGALIPGQFAYLRAGLFIAFSFLQLAAWYYFVSKTLEIVRQSIVT